MSTTPPIKEFYTDELHRRIYATDASVYRYLPSAVAYPKNTDDLRKLIAYAHKKQHVIIPRAAGTSLGGQCIGNGIVVDISRYFTKILDFDKKKRTVTVQPGVLRDQLNDFLKPHGLFFGPNTSTSNRCTMGGMVGNNSSGTSSIRYGVTRDKVIALKTLLSNGSEVTFTSLKKSEIKEKIAKKNLEGNIYQLLYNRLSNREIQNEIRREFPKTSIHRRNTGYAIDTLLNTNLFTDSGEDFNMAKLLCGSEGTLAFSTEITLQLDPLLPQHKIVIAVHFHNLYEALQAVVISMKHTLYMCELMDNTILEQTKNNRTQTENRDFIKGEPEALLLLEVAASTDAKAEELAHHLINDLQHHNMGYFYPKLKGKNIRKAIDLRAAGLGLLGNIVGDSKAVACIEDTAVALEDLSEYIREFDKLMNPYRQKFVYFAHAGAGELHLRPILNLKKSDEVKLFYEITEKVAHLVKKYRGSFSGEHGDGIVRSGFLPFMIGEKNYTLLKEIKQTFDPKGVFNKGKIIEALPMTENLRYKADRTEPDIQTLSDFSDNLGILRATEKCNGSGDCRKLQASGGTMCPSYRATGNEKDTTRARVNALREFLTHSPKSNRFNHKALYEVFDLCLSCKACVSECPSTVDVAALKAEFLYQYQKANGIPFRSKLFAYNASLNKIGRSFPKITNTFLNASFVKKRMGIAAERNIPELAPVTFRQFIKKQKKQSKSNRSTLLLFIDEYTNYYDPSVGRDAYKLFTRLGYEVQTLAHKESGRASLSKGLLHRAKKIADTNIRIFKELVSDDLPLVGIEPSAILSFKDEYLRLATDKEGAKKVAQCCYTIESFFQREIQKGVISPSDFTDLSLDIKIHGHCHQKSLEGMQSGFTMLNIPKNYNVTILNTGCCGMAGAFGYEKEHYKISMQVGETEVFPKIRKLAPKAICVASGTSCRHQIWDGTKRKSYHPASVLLRALKKQN